MQKKIEFDILTIILMEAVFLLFFFKENLLTLSLGIILGITLTLLTNNIKKNKLTKLCLLVASIPFCVQIFFKTISFINYNILKEHSFIIIAIVFLLLSIYLVTKNYHTFIKTFEISFYLFIFIKTLSLILIVPKININNLLSYNALSVNYNFIIIGITILYIYKSLNYLTNYKFNKKTILSLINPLYIKLLTILVLSNTLVTIYKYPYMDYLKTIRYFDFIERIDGLLSFEYLICFFALFTFVLFNIKLLLKKAIK